jgi:hypothetical protein
MEAGRVCPELQQPKDSQIWNSVSTLFFFLQETEAQEQIQTNCMFACVQSPWTAERVLNIVGVTKERK